MPVFYDLRKDIRFKQGLKEGFEEGLEKGKLKKARLVTIRALKKGAWSVTTIADILDVPLPFVLKIQEELEKNPNLK